MKKRGKNLRNTFKDKAQMSAILVLILSIFLLDVNANLIGAYGSEIKVNFLNGVKFPATSMFWLGFISSALSFFILSTRSRFDRKYNSNTDLIFSITGIIGLMIILSGGLLIFWHNNAQLIPFFNLYITRITYYHIGIGLELITLFYFALTK